jgi:DNA/RNA endonuclease G (NUC1)
LKRLLLLIALISLDANALTQRQPLPPGQCQVHVPYGVSQTSTYKLQHICREAYLVEYDAENKIPNSVSWSLTPDRAIGCIPRTNTFVTDASVPGGPTPEDYVDSQIKTIGKESVTYGYITHAIRVSLCFYISFHY